jgi:hypothetical protein
VEGVACDNLDVRRYASVPAALHAFDQQQVYAALDVTAKSPTLYVASAAGASVARVLERSSRVDSAVHVVELTSSCDGTASWGRRVDRGYDRLPSCGVTSRVVDKDDADRAARNEATFRTVNEAIERGRRTREGLIGFVCECGRLGCNELIELTLPEYEALRADPRRFAIRHGHEAAVEDVVEAHERYLVVAKKGRAGDIAALHDPR